MGFLLLSVEALPSMINCRFVMGLSQASQISPSAGPSQNRATPGRLPEVDSKIWSKLTIRADCGLRLLRPPFVIPHLKADDVELNGPATRQGGYRREHMLLRKEHVATLARFSGAWTAPGPRNAVIRQATVPKLALD